MLNHLRSKETLIILLIAFLLFILNLGGYPLVDVDEPRYAETAREMLAAPGDWITPHFNWMIRFDKPVLFYWLIALSYMVFGISPFAARLVSALAATGVMVMLYLFASESFSRKVGLLTAVIFATMLEVYALARWAVTDMTLVCFMTGTWLGLYLAMARSPKWFLVAGIAGGLGTLTKGPVAIVLPGLTFLITLAWHYREQWKKILFSPWLFGGLTLFMAVTLPWYVAVSLAHPETFLETFVLLHNIERFTNTVSGHSGPWYYYVPVILLGAFPWVFFAPAMMKHLFIQRHLLPNHIGYAALWFTLVFLFFSLAETKLITYILPALPALALLLGWYIHQRITQHPPGQTTRHLSWSRLGLWFVLGCTGVVLVLSLIKPYLGIPPSVHSLYQPAVYQTAIVILLVTFGVTLFFSYKQPQIAFKSLSAGMVVAMVYANLFVLPQAVHIIQHDMLAFARQAVKDNAVLSTYSMKKPSLVFYTRQKVYYLKTIKRDKDGNRTHERPDKPIYVVLKNRKLTQLILDNHPFTLIQQGKVYSLIRIPGIKLSQEGNQ